MTCIIIQLLDAIFPTRMTPGPGCSKLTTLLVKNALKFQMLKSQICQYFLSKKMFLSKKCSHFFNKNFSVFAYRVVKHLRS